jgi:hemerythrin superfamily protein
MPSTAPRSIAAKTRSRTGTTGPDAIKLLKADHDEAEAVFEQFEKAKSPDRKKALADKVCMALRVHTVIEEEIFYPACKGEVDDDLLDEAQVEHNGAKELIAQIEAGSPDDALWEAKVTVLSEYIKHHVKEEEQAGGLFSQARKAGVDMKMLGARLAARKDELMQEMKAQKPN